RAGLGSARFALRRANWQSRPRTLAGSHGGVTSCGPPRRLGRLRHARRGLAEKLPTTPAATRGPPPCRRPRGMKRTLAGIRSSPGLFMVCSAAVAVAVFLLGAFLWTGLQVAHWGEALAGGKTLVIYFDSKAEKKDVDAAAATLSARADVAS